MNYFLLNIGQQLINLTSVLLYFSVILHMDFVKNNVPVKRDEIFMWKKRPTKARSQFYESGISVEFFYEVSEIFSLLLSRYVFSSYNHALSGRVHA